MAQPWRAEYSTLPQPLLVSAEKTAVPGTARDPRRAEPPRTPRRVPLVGGNMRRSRLLLPGLLGRSASKVSPSGFGEPRNREERRTMDPFIGTETILYWRREEGTPDDDAMGVAWVVEGDGTERLINGGDPISRTEAERLAVVGKHILDAEP